MTAYSRLFACLLLSLCCYGFAAAQTPPAQAGKPDALTIVAATTERGVRFTALGAADRLRLEVYSAAGDLLYDTGFRAGSLLDWAATDGEGRVLADGTYSCVITAHDPAGGVRVKQGGVTVEGGRAALELADAGAPAAAAPAADQQPSREQRLAALSVGEAPAMTAVAHDGADGQLTRTRGALSFRLGDFFSGQDREQMRLTEAGRLGIGTPDPQATLDVAGTIRAERVLIAKRGEDAGKGQAAASEGPGVALASGSGTQNQLAKWLDGAGTLADSAVTEVRGNVGIGTQSPNPNGVLHANKSQNTGTAIFVTNPNTGAGSLSSVRAGLNPDNYAVDYTTLTILGANWPAGAGGPFLKGRTSLLEGNGSNFGIGNFSDTEPLIFYTTSARSERMRITAAGNVGIGTTSPLRTLQLGPSPDAAFTFSPSDGSPNAGYIRFGDHTGWKLHFARNRESSGGSLNTGTAGELSLKKVAASASASAART